MKKLKGHAISGVFVFLLLGIFAVISVVMVLFGASAYKNSSQRVEMHNAERVQSSYVRAMTRGWDSVNGIYTEQVDAVSLSYEDGSDEPVVEDLGKIDSVVLVRSDSEDEDPVIDRLYVFNGHLMERLQYEEEYFEPWRGMEICEAEKMSAEYENGLLRLNIVYAGETTQVVIAPRAGR